MALASPPKLCKARGTCNLMSRRANSERDMAGIISPTILTYMSTERYCSSTSFITFSFARKFYCCFSTASIFLVLIYS